MRNIDENTITAAVLQRIEATADPRLKQVLSALIRHLHDFVREVKLTETEWKAGIDFLTAVGHMCDERRQEFILLSDTLGVSMLTVALNHVVPPGATEATGFGPFPVADAPRVQQGANIAGDAPGIPLFVNVRVQGLDGQPIAGAEVDTWQADEEGLYDVQRPELGSARRARGVLRSDAGGIVRFRSIVPTAYPIPTDGPVGRMLVATGRHPWRPAHVHFMIKAHGYQTLVTHLFKEPDPYLESDVVFGVRSSLVGRFVEHDGGIAPDGTRFTVPFFTLDHTFVLAEAT